MYKPMKLLSYISASVAVMAVLTSCDGKNEPAYEPADEVRPGQRVFFAAPTVQVNVADGENAAIVPVYRPQDDSASPLVVDIISTDPSALFKVPTTVSFAAGQLSAEIVVTFSNDALEPNRKYSVNLDIAEPFANQYAVTSTTAVICHSVWTDWEQFGVDPAQGRDGLGTYVYTLLMDEPEVVKPVRVMYRTNPLNTDEMQFEAQTPADADNPDSEWETFFTFESADGGSTLTVPEQESMPGPDGMIYVMDMYSYTGSAEYKGKSTYDAATGTFRFNIVYFDEIGVWNYGYEQLQLNGFTTDPGEDEGEDSGGEDAGEDSATPAPTVKARVNPRFVY